MFKNMCCDLAKSTHKFCGICGTDLVLERKLKREEELKRRGLELFRKILRACEFCNSLGQDQNYCTCCGKKDGPTPLPSSFDNQD